MTFSNLGTLKRRTLVRSLGEGFRRRVGTMDIIIPVAGKDSPCLEQVIRAARKYLRHHVGGIYLVYRELPKGAWTKSRDVILLDERDVGPVSKSSIAYRPRGVDRSGWLYQQLIKLSCDQICRSEYVLALDSDTVFTRPQRLIKNGKVVLNVSDERYEPYYRMIERLLPGTSIFPYSFVSHHMLFTKTHLRELKLCMEQGGKKWFEAILENIDREDMSGFSEYELYGNYMTTQHPRCVSVEHSLNQGFSASRIPLLWYLKLRHPLMKSASFHNR